MSQVNPKIFFYNTAFSVQLPYHTLSVTPFKTKWTFKEGGNIGTIEFTLYDSVHSTTPNEVKVYRVMMYANPLLIV